MKNALLQETDAEAEALKAE